MGENKIKFILALIAVVIFNSLASILLKYGMRSSQLENQNYIQIAKYALLNPIVWAGMVSFALSFVSYSIVLTKVKLSVAYPVLTSGGFVLVVLFSVLFFKESLTGMQIVGFIFLLVGVWFVSTAMK